jgi:hypothetical protein
MSPFRKTRRPVPAKYVQWMTVSRASPRPNDSRDHPGTRCAGQDQGLLSHRQTEAPRERQRGRRRTGRCPRSGPMPRVAPPATRRPTTVPRTGPTGCPTSRTSGMGSGTARASRGSHVCSLATWGMYAAELGSRTLRRGPSRKVRWSFPPGATNRTGSPLHSGNCSLTSARTSAAVIACGSAWLEIIPSTTPRPGGACVMPPRDPGWSAAQLVGSHRPAHPGEVGRDPPEPRAATRERWGDPVTGAA